jgi:hypothetical protein
MTGTLVSEYGIDAPSRDCARVTDKREVIPREGLPTIRPECRARMALPGCSALYTGPIGGSIRANLEHGSWKCNCTAKVSGNAIPAN